MGQDNGKDGFNEMKDNRTDNIVEYAYNMDNGYVEVWFIPLPIGKAFTSSKVLHLLATAASRIA